MTDYEEGAHGRTDPATGGGQTDQAAGREQTDPRAADGHDHGAGRGGTSTRKLALVSVINLVGFAVELAGGLLFGSVALVSDAVHMLFDALAYVMAFAAAYVAARYGETDRWSYGLHRLEPLSAFLNGLLLFPMVGFILWEAYQRFLAPVDIAAGPTLAIATGGLLVNVGSVVVLQGDEMSLNERGAFYHLLGDAGGSVAVIVSTVVVELTGLRVVDPLVAALIAGLVVWSSLKVLAGSSAIFLQRTPVDLASVRADLREVAGVEAVGDVHAWQVCSSVTVATAHVETDAETMADADTVADAAHEVLARHGVDHATVELTRTLDGRSALDAHGHE